MTVLMSKKLKKFESNKSEFFLFQIFHMSLASKSQLRFAKLSENAFPPLKGSDYAAGWDLRRLVSNNLHFRNK